MVQLKIGQRRTVWIKDTVRKYTGHAVKEYDTWWDFLDEKSGKIIQIAKDSISHAYDPEVDNFSFTRHIKNK